MGILARQNLEVFLSVGGGRVWLREMRCKYHLGSDLTILQSYNYEYHVISWRSWKGSIWSIASVPTTVIYIRRVLTGSIYQTPGPSPWLCNYDSVSIVLDIYIIGAVSIYHVTKKWPPLLFVLPRWLVRFIYSRSCIYLSCDEKVTTSLICFATVAGEIYI